MKQPWIHAIIIGSICATTMFQFLNASASGPSSTDSSHRSAIHAAYARIQNEQIMIPPLPGGNIGPTPDGEACCIRGMVWFNGVPVASAEVTIQSSSGSVTVFTEVFSGTTSTESRPFYQAILYEPPLSTPAGSIITLTARFSGYSQTITHTASATDEQVDITIPRPSATGLGFASDIRNTLTPTSTFTYPAALAHDSKGNVYVGGSPWARVKVYSPTGQFIREWGDYGNLPGRFGRISSITVDKQDNVYVADGDNQRVTKFTSDSTFLQTWRLDCPQCAAIGRLSLAVKRNGHLLVNTVTTGAGVLEEFDAAGNFIKKQANDSGVFTNSQPGHPGVALDDAENIYVADYANGRIIKYAPDMTLVSGELWSTTQITGAMGIAMGTDGFVYVLRVAVATVDTGVYVQKYTQRGELKATLQLDPSTTGEPWDITVVAGLVLIADRTANWIWQVPLDLSSSKKWLYGGRVFGGLTDPRGMVALGDDLYVTDCLEHAITRFHGGVPQKVWHGADIGFGAVWCPYDLAQDKQGRFWAVDANANLLQRFTISGDTLTVTHTWGSLGVAIGQFNAPTGLSLGASDAISDVVFVADSNNGRVQALRMDASDTLVPITATSTITGIGIGQFVSPIDVVVDGNNNVFVLDTKLARLTKFKFAAGALTLVGTYGSEGHTAQTLSFPRAVAIAPSGHVFIADNGNSRVVEVAFGPTGDGTLVNLYGTVTGSNNSLVAPGGMVQVSDVAFDAQGSMYVSQNSTVTPLIQKFEVLTHTAPTAAISALSNNAGALDATSTLTVTGIGQASDISRTIVTYEWTFTSPFYSAIQFTTTGPQLVVPAAQLLKRVQFVSLRVQDSAGEWSPRATSNERIFVSTLPPVTPLPTATPLTPLPTATPPSGPVPALHDCPDTNWLMMVYGAFDNPDDGARLLARLNEVLLNLGQSASKNPCVKFALQLDGPQSITSTIGDTTRWLGEPGQPLQQVQGITEQAMDQSDTLHAFVVWAQGQSPARHYYLAIADHGQGILGTGWDFSTNQPTSPLGPNDGSYYLRASDIARALTASDVIPIDILHLDACSMGLVDVAYELRDAAKILIVSQYLGWAFFGYDDYIQSIGNATSAKYLAAQIVLRYDAAIRDFALPHTLSALDLSHVGQVKVRIDALAVRLKAWVSFDPARVATLADLRDQSQLFNSNHDLINSGADVYVDLLDWAQHVRAYFTDTVTQGDIRAAADDLIGLLKTSSDGLIIANRVGNGALPAASCLTGLDCNIRFTDATGISLYYPPEVPGPGSRAVMGARTIMNPSFAPGQLFADYIGQRSFQFTQASRWDEFLTAALPPHKPGTQDDLVVPAPPKLMATIYLPLVRR